MKNLNEWIETFWVRVPFWTWRWTRGGAHALVDGNYLLAWPSVAAVAPFFVFLIGIFLGGHFFLKSETFTSSIWILVYLIACSCFSAALGLWTSLGYIVMDLLYYKHQKPYSIHTILNCQPLQDVVSLLPLIIIYFLLITLVAGIPFMSQKLSLLSLGIQEKNNKSESFLRAIYQALLIYIWMEAAPILIRPIYVWNDESPKLNAIEPMQTKGWLLAFIAFGLLWARTRLEAHAADTPSVRAYQDRIRVGFETMPFRSWPIPAFWNLPLKTAITVFLLSGMMTQWWEIPILTFGLGFAFWLQSHPRVPKAIRVFREAPFLIRLLGATAAAYALGYGFVLATGRDDVKTFLPVILALVISQIIFALLMPRKTISETPR